VRGSRIEGEGSDGLGLTATPDRPEEDGRSGSWTLELALRGELPEGELGGRIVILTDDPQHPQIAARWIRRAQGR
jgi:hypothetical protein